VTVIVVLPTNTSMVGKYLITVLDEKRVVPLSEGKSLLTKVEKGDYAFFSFYLPEDPPAVSEVLFFVNTLSGSTTLLASPQFPKPSIESIGKDPSLKLGIDKISFLSTEIREGMYYFGIYGYEYSDLVVTIIIRRQTKNNKIPIITPTNIIVPKTELSEFQLFDSIAQVFTLDKGTSTMTFVFKSLGIGKVILQVTDIVGKVQTYVTFKNNHTRMSCTGNYCEFDGQPA
jgi:hypothetical protein